MIAIIYNEFCPVTIDDMYVSNLRLVIGWALFLLFTGIGTAGSAASTQKQAPPQLILWSWYEGGDFNFVDNNVGVAYLALSLRFEGRDQVIPSPRRVPIHIPSRTYQMAVIRLNFPSWNKNQIPAFSNTQRDLAVRMVAEIAEFSKTRAIQIDFDAPSSARPFYRQLLFGVRQRLGPDVFLSITALASWCEDPKSWLAGLPVDEIVPMAFRMGPATGSITTMLNRGGEFSFPGCRNSIGIELPNPRVVYGLAQTPAPMTITVKPPESTQENASTQHSSTLSEFLTGVPAGESADKASDSGDATKKQAPVFRLERNPAFLQSAGPPPEPIRARASQRAYFFPQMQRWTPEILKKAREQIQP
jgi:hypothetical protein